MAASVHATSSPLTNVRLSLVLGSTYTTVRVEVGALERDGFHVERYGHVRLDGMPSDFTSGALSSLLTEVSRLTAEAAMEAASEVATVRKLR